MLFFFIRFLDYSLLLSFVVNAISLVIRFSYIDFFTLRLFKLNLFIVMCSAHSWGSLSLCFFYCFVVFLPCCIQSYFHFGLSFCVKMLHQNQNNIKSHTLFVAFLILSFYPPFVCLFVHTFVLRFIWPMKKPTHNNNKNKLFIKYLFFYLSNVQWAFFSIFIRSFVRLMAL